MRAVGDNGLDRCDAVRFPSLRHVGKKRLGELIARALVLS